MMCEMCGEEKLHLYRAIVEGSLISVCDKCKKFGEVISVERPKTEEPIKEKRKLEQKPVKEENQEIVVDDCADKVRAEREKRSMTQEELAKSVAEKESVIHKIESKQITPSIQVAKKLEQFLNIKLIEEFDPNKETTKELNFKDEALTIGDIIRLKKK